mmetsp:Transcript_43044/g.49454  ORF Transcript_43044/g.49454 Transcript_43044/m.49454 type:complete len:259 (-) Transcript_43044:80-856(-)
MRTNQMMMRKSVMIFPSGNGCGLVVGRTSGREDVSMKKMKIPVITTVVMMTTVSVMILTHGNKFGRVFGGRNGTESVSEVANTMIPSLWPKMRMFVKMLRIGGRFGVICGRANGKTIAFMKMKMKLPPMVLTAMTLKPGRVAMAGNGRENGTKNVPKKKWRKKTPAKMSPNGKHSGAENGSKSGRTDALRKKMLIMKNPNTSAMTLQVGNKCGVAIGRKSMTINVSNTISPQIGAGVGVEIETHEDRNSSFPLDEGAV